MTLQVQRMTRGVHAASDFDAAVAFYRDVFGARVIAADYLPADREPTRATMLAIGSTGMSVFSPRVPDSVVGHYIGKYGEGFHSMEWLVPELDEAAEAIEAAGVKLMFRRYSSFFTHPRDSHGVLMQLTHLAFTPDPRLEPDWTDGYWRDEHPLGIDRLNAVLCAVEDPPAAAAFFRDAIGARVLGSQTVDGQERTFLFFGDTLLELRASFDPERAQRFGRRALPGLQALVFRVADLARARRYLEGRALRLCEDALTGGIATDPAQTFGAVYAFTEEEIPGDPRT